MIILKDTSGGYVTTEKMLDYRYERSCDCNDKRIECTPKVSVSSFECSLKNNEQIDVKDIVTQEALELLEEKHDPNKTIQILSLTQADNGEYCHCENCSSLDEATGSPAGTMLTFVNEMVLTIC